MRKSDEIKSVGFNTHDRQIYESLHDEIVIWLYGKMSEGKVRDWLLKPILENKNLTVSRWEGGAYNGKWIRHPVTAAKIKSFKTQIEFPIVNGYQHTAVKAFIDLYADVNLVAPNDLGVEGSVCDCRIFIEVKTSVNVGETLRQFAYYRQVAGETAYDLWFLCAPPMPHVDIFKDHQISFIPYRRPE